MSRPRVILLVGPVFAGKSRFVERLAGALRGEGLAIAGFLQRGVFAPDGRKIGYDLVGLSSGAVRPFARRSEAGGRWLFEDAAFAAARDELHAGAGLVVVDEMGHLELAGGGHAAVIDQALASSPVTLIVVREALADLAEERMFAHADVTVVRFAPGQEEEMSAKIRESLAG